MKTQTEALNLIHEQLQKLWLLGDKAAELANPALDAIKEALMSVPDGAQSQQEPVIDKSAAIRIATVLGWEPKREWIGLTDEEYQELQLQTDASYFYLDYGLAIEAKLKEKNTIIKTYPEKDKT